MFSNFSSRYMIAFMVNISAVQSCGSTKERSMWRPSVVSILSFVFLLYISHSIWTLYTLFHPKTCDGKDSERCLKAAIVPNPTTGVWPAVQLRVYISNSATSKSLGAEIHRHSSLNIDAAYEKQVSYLVRSRSLCQLSFLTNPDPSLPLTQKDLK